MKLTNSTKTTNPKQAKLALRREVLRVLDADQLALVAGGGPCKFTMPGTGRGME